MCGTELRYRLRLDGTLLLEGRARLVARDWRDGTGTIRCHIAIQTESGRTQELWSGFLSAAAARGGPAGIDVRCELPADIAALVLRADQHVVVDGRSVGRIEWVDLSLSAVDLNLKDRTAGTPASEKHQLDAGSRAETLTGTGTDPTISVLTPVHDPPLEMLAACVASVLEQTYTNWRLHLVDDGSSNPAVIAALQEYAAQDPRIDLQRNETAHGIAGATNRALHAATGEFVALLDHDDWLAPNALERVAEAIAENQSADMLYTDEDIVLDGRQIWIHHKQAWSPDVLRTNGYTCHLGIYRRELLNAIGGFRSEFNGSQDVDMILRFTEHTDQIVHIPEILYHWRAHAASTAGGDAKPYAYVAARNAITEHLERTAIGGHVDFGPPGLYRVIHPSDSSQRVAIATAGDHPSRLVAAVRSWVQQPHDNWHATIAVEPGLQETYLSALAAAGLDTDRLEFLEVQAGDPGGALAAAAGAASDADDLLLMETPAVGLTHDWLTRLLGYATQAGIAAAGPIVLAADGRILDAGLAIPDQLPLYLLYGQTTSMDHHFGFGTSVHDVTAVGSVLMTNVAVFKQAGGLDPSFRELMLAEYCLRAASGELRTVTVPDARVQCSSHAVNDLVTMRRLARAFAERPGRSPRSGDPYYNPNYRTDRGDFCAVRDDR